MEAVGLGERGGEHRARAQLQFRAELVVGDLVVALIGDAVDDWVLDHAHNEVVAHAAELDVLKQAGGVEGFQAAVDAIRVEPVARLDQQVGADRALLDALVAFDLDRVDDAGGRCRTGGGRVGWRPVGALAGARLWGIGRWRFR